MNTLLLNGVLAASSLTYARGSLDQSRPIAYQISSGENSSYPIYLLGSIHLGLEPAQSVDFENKVTNFFDRVSPEHVFFEADLMNIWSREDIYQGSSEHYVYKTAQKYNAKFGMLEDVYYQRKMLENPVLRLNGYTLSVDLYQKFSQSYPAITYYIPI